MICHIDNVFEIFKLYKKNIHLLNQSDQQHTEVVLTMISCITSLRPARYKIHILIYQKYYHQHSLSFTFCIKHDQFSSFVSLESAPVPLSSSVVVAVVIVGIDVVGSVGSGVVVVAAYDPSVDVVLVGVNVQKIYCQSE